MFKAIAKSRQRIVPEEISLINLRRLSERPIMSMARIPEPAWKFFEVTSTAGLLALRSSQRVYFEPEE